MNPVLVFDVRTAFLVLSLVGWVQAVGSWMALRASLGRPLAVSQQLWVAGSAVAGCMGVTIALRGAPAPLANLLTSHALMLIWLGLSWNALQLERGRPARWSVVSGCVLASLAVYGAGLLALGEARLTAYPALAALLGALLVARQAWAIERAEASGGARMVAAAFTVTALALMVRAVHLLGSELPQTSVTSGPTQIVMTVGGISVFVLGNLGYLGLQLERLTAGRLNAEVRQARAEERSLQAQERVRALQEVIDERDLLIRRLQRLDAFQQQAVAAAALPHELRQPLGAMRLNLDTLARSLSGKGVVPTELVKELDQDTQRLSTMVEDFMALISPPVGQDSSVLAPVDIVSVLHSSLDVVRPRAQQAQVELRLQSGQRVSLRACPVSLHQLMLILLTNALDAVCDHPGPRRITVEFVQAAGQWQVCVRDSGPGIPEHVRPHLFEPFASSKPQGSGIGLALARRLAQRFGAQLLAPQEPGQALQTGAAFMLTFPVEAAPPAQA